MTCESELPVLASSSRGRVAPIPAIEDSFRLKLLPFVLSLVAGSLDITGFLGLGGLFTAHITGNVVVLAARLVAHEPSPLSYAIAVPVFIVILVLTRLFVAGLDRIAVPSLLPLLVLQFLFLLMGLTICIAAGLRADPYGPEMTLAGMLAVSGMAVQNALVRVSLAGPSTAVMTTNVSVFTMDLGEILFGRSQSGRAKARVRARRTWPSDRGIPTRLRPRCCVRASIRVGGARYPNPSIIAGRQSLTVERLRPAGSSRSCPAGESF
jgi:uncharacterized membrane protein YoaK (UPF0700 family)